MNKQPQTILENFLSIPKGDIFVEGNYPRQKYGDRKENMGIRCAEKREYFLKDFTSDKEYLIVDKHGNMPNLPKGFVLIGDKYKTFIDNNKIALKSIQTQTVYYRFSIENFSGDIAIVVWCIQPDGRYWEDEDGFGGTNDNEINLYSVIDKRGRFLLPFQYFEKYLDAKTTLLPIAKGV